MNRRRMVVTLMLVVLAGCGSSGAESSRAPESTPTTTTVEQSVEAAANEYLSVLLRGDGPAVYAAWSQRCKATKTETQVNETITLAGAMYGTAKLVSTTVTMNGPDQATVVGVLDTPALNDPAGKRWTRENGVWKWDGCAA